MKIVVCLKQTFDTEEHISIQNGKINENGVEFVINPYDEYAVEAAIRLKEKHDGEVTAITIGPERAEHALRTALAMGADQGIIVTDETLVDGDENTTAKVLAAVIDGLEYDIILCGYMAIDDGAAQIGLRLAEHLGVPHISTITSLEIEGNTVNVEKDMEGDIVRIHAELPVLLTAQQGLNEPRYPSLPGIMKAKKKPLQRLTVGDLSLDADDVVAKTEVLEVCLPAQKTAGRILEGELDDQVAELVDVLINEKKVI